MRFARVWVDQVAVGIVRIEQRCVYGKKHKGARHWSVNRSLRDRDKRSFLHGLYIRTQTKQALTLENLNQLVMRVMDVRGWFGFLVNMYDVDGHVQSVKEESTPHAFRRVGTQLPDQLL